MEKNQILQIWEKLPFDYFGNDEKRIEWQGYALEILKGLELGNVGLIADTGTGKTIMSILVFKALSLIFKSLNIRALFVTPTVILTDQHAALYKIMTGETPSVLNGTDQKRDWTQGSLIIATPHVFMIDSVKGLINENAFSLLIVDEMHKGEGKYPYVSLAKAFNASNVPILSMSASPGASDEDIADMEKLYCIKTWITADIKKHEVKNRLIKTELSPELIKADIFLKKFCFETLKSLSEVFEVHARKIIIPINEDNPFLTQAEESRLEGLVNTLPKLQHHQGEEHQPDFYDAISLFHRQRKISYLYRILMTESFASFFDYVEKKLVSSTAKASQAIVNNGEFREIYWNFKNNPTLHPKEKALIDLMSEMNYKNKNWLVFVSSKVLADHLSRLFNSQGFKSEVLVGGKGKSIKKQAQVINDFSRGEIQIIFATSVVEEGLSLPEVDVVIHYNQPITEISRLQKGGRTGRFRVGLVVFIIMNISYENALYFATLAKLKKMKSMFYESARREVAENKSGKKKKQMELVGQLFLDFTEESLLIL
jgi:ERCC4-related helicase